MKILILIALALLGIGVAGCDTRSGEYDRGYNEGFLNGQESGQSAGYDQGYAAGFAEARPPGWSPETGFGRFVLGLTAFLGGVLAFGGALTLILYLMLKIWHPFAIAAKGTVALLAGLSAWVLTTVATTEQFFFSILLAPVPASSLLLLVIIVVFGAVAYGIVRITLQLIDNIKGVRLEAVTIGLVTFVAAIILQAFVEALSSAAYMMAYLICYILIGFAVGGGLNVVRLLILEYEQDSRKQASRGPGQ
jgi:hypothetical protein